MAHPTHEETKKKEKKIGVKVPSLIVFSLKPLHFQRVQQVIDTVFPETAGNLYE